jgi:hypothetical protein
VHQPGLAAEGQGARAQALWLEDVLQSVAWAPGGGGGACSDALVAGALWSADVVSRTRWGKPHMCVPCVRQSTAGRREGVQGRPSSRLGAPARLDARLPTVWLPHAASMRGRPAKAPHASRRQAVLASGI